jgi:hypothetical protein
MSDFAPLHDDETGEHIGWVTEASDGAIIGLDDEGNVLGAFTPDGEELDPDEYQLVTSEDDADEDPYPGLTERLDALEEAQAQPRQVEYVDPGPDWETTMDDLGLQTDHIERLLDRPLTLDERRRIAREAAADVAAGDERPDALAIARRLEDLGEGLLDVDDEHRGRAHQNRVELITQRLADDERYADQDAGYDDVTEAEPPQTQEFYEMDDRDERMSYYADRLRDSGAGPEDLYSSSDASHEEE